MADQVAEFTAYILDRYPLSAPALIRAMVLKDERIAALVAENEMLSRSLDESLFCNVQGVAERLAAQPQPQPAQPLTGARMTPFNRETKDQIASVMLQHGTPEQQAKALEYAAGITAPSTPTPEVAPCATPTLLACPFCGGPANFLDACEPRKPLYWAECKACGVPGADDVSVEGAAAKWNRRAALTQGAGATIEWQVRGRHHYEWRRASEEIARAMYLVNPGHVRAVTVIEGAVPKAG